MAKAVQTKISQESLMSLRRWNCWLAALFALEAAALLVLSKRAEMPITSTYLTRDSVQSSLAGHTVLAPATHQLWMVNAGYLVALFLLIAAAAHLCAGTIYREKYEVDLKRSISKIRWAEYALNGGVMIIVIALLSGLYDFATLVGLFALTAGGQLLGVAVEATEDKRRSFVYWLSVGMGAVPWVILALFLWGSSTWGSGYAPAFVYWIFGTMLVSFAALAALTRRQIGHKSASSKYAYAERAYMLLSFIAKTVLAWQVFAGALRS